ncbi:hypothetical protein Acsp01_79590 [Actinoplanes sp. NBRC 101535]|nr:hypothetical protein Acsp01_79590 [Actinoplanes sp. NBRC 101535]
MHADPPDVQRLPHAAVVILEIHAAVVILEAQAIAVILEIQAAEAEAVFDGVEVGQAFGVVAGRRVTLGECLQGPAGFQAGGGEGTAGLDTEFVQVAIEEIQMGLFLTEVSGRIA